MNDRLKGPLAALARRADPLVLYRSLYRSRLVRQSSDLLRVDVATDDPLLPEMSNIPLHHGLPGLALAVSPGAYLLVGWANGRPDVPFAALWSNPNQTGAANARGTGGGGGSVDRIALVTALLELGEFGAADAVIKGSTYRTAEVALHVFLQATLAAAGAALSSAGGVGSHGAAQPFLTAAGAGLSTAASAIQAFENQAATFLSTKVRTG
jgi:hypothetical protein